MISHALKSPLVLGLAVFLTQFGTPSRALADEVSKTDKKSDTTSEAKIETKAEMKPDPVEQVPAAGTYPDKLLSLTSLTGSFSQFAFLVDKATRTLTVWKADGDKVKLVGAWPADIGRTGGDKVSEGDFKTPEGIYFFESKMDGQKVDFSQYGSRIFTMDYPNYFDKLEKKTGHGIWLHAIPETKSLLRGSRGCVVVRNKVIEELGQYIELKSTPIVVVNSVTYLNEAQWNEQRKTFSTWLEDWRKTWMGKDFEKYMAQYSERFQSMGMNKAKWYKYKKILGDRYKFINVDLKDVQIFNHGKTIVLRFLQDYKSDGKQDFGVKILYAMKVGDKYEIVGENWQPMKTPGSMKPETASPAMPSPASVTPSASPSPASASAASSTTSAN